MLFPRAVVVATFLWLGHLWGHGVAARQVDDNPDYFHFRAGHFATPVKVEGDKQKRLISSIQIICESLDEAGGQGSFLIDQSKLEFNAFGDATPVQDERSQQYRISLERVTNEQPEKRVPRRPTKLSIQNRSIYTLVFEEDFCDQTFFLNLSKQPAAASRLVQCSQDKVSEPWLGGGPKVVRIYQLSRLGIQMEPPGDEEIGHAISLRTPALQLVPGKTTSGITVTGKLGGAGTLTNDLNQTTLSDYGDSGMQTLAGYMPRPIQLLEKEIKDPRQRGRRVFDVAGHPDSPRIRYSIVLSPTIAGKHRLLIRHGDVVSRVIPLTDRKWQVFSAKLRSLKDENSVATVTAIRKIVGNGLDFWADNGSVTRIRLQGGKVNDDALQLVSKLKNLSGLELSHCPEITASGLEAVGKLNSLKSLSLRNTLSNDRLLKLAAQLPQLSSLQIYHDPSAIYAKHRNSGFAGITDAGVSKIANATQLKSLKLSGEKITDQGIENLDQQSKLRSLSLHNTEATLGQLIHLCRALPTCSISSATYKSSESSQTVSISDGGGKISISGHFAEEEFAPLAELMNLESLSLPKSATDKTLRTISGIGTLQTLTMQNNRQITNRGIEHLVALSELRELSLWYCEKLTNDCTQHLRQMSNLKKLTLGGTKVSRSAIDELRSALPDCEVKR